MNCQRMLFRQTMLFSRYLMLKTGSILFVLYGGNIPFLVSLCFASQRTPTVCPHCAGSISTIGLRSFLLKVSGVSSHLSFCCTCLVSGFIIPGSGGLVYSQSAQRYAQSFSIFDKETVQLFQLHKTHAIVLRTLPNLAGALWKLSASECPNFAPPGAKTLDFPAPER